MKLRSERGWDRVAAALEIAGPCSAEAILAAVGAPEVDVSEHPSRIRPGARGRYLAGRITLFPAAFADAYTLAHTALHELAHARGADEAAAEAWADARLKG
jgi:hypothetical protein